MPDQHDFALPLPWLRPGIPADPVVVADGAACDLDPTDWAEFRATAHRALDGMLDHLATHPRPAGLAADAGGGAHRAPHRAGGGGRGHRRGAGPVRAADPALRHRQHPPALHGLGARRRQRRRAAGRDAGRRAERQSGRARPCADPGGAPGDRLDGRAVRPAGGNRGAARHRHLDRQPDRRADRARRRGGAGGAARRGGRAAAGRLHLGRRAWLHSARDGHGRAGHRGAAADPDRRGRTDGRGGAGGARSRATAPRGCARSCWSAPRAPSISARSTIWPRSPRSPGARGCGFMSMARSARWPPSPRNCVRCWPGSRPPTAWRSISTNGARCRTTPAASWCATRVWPSRPSPLRPPICGGRRAAWPAARPGPAIWAPICRAASGR